MTPASPPGSRWWLYRTCQDCGQSWIVGTITADERMKTAIDGLLEVATPMPAESSAARAHWPGCKDPSTRWEWVSTPGSSMRQHFPGAAPPDAL